MQPSQSTRQRTAWCTTSAGRSSIRSAGRETRPARDLPSSSVTDRSPSTPVCDTERNSVIQITWHKPRTTTIGLPARRGHLLDFVSRTPADAVPADVLHESTRCLLDHLGLAIAGAAEPAAGIARDQCRMLGGDPQARALGTADRLRVTDAALVNGIACHALDFDDTHVPTILHPTTPLYAAGTALAEWRGSRGIDLLAAHAARLRARRPGQQRALPRALRRGLAHDRNHRRAGVGDGRDQAARPRRV